MSVKKRDISGSPQTGRQAGLHLPPKAILPGRAAAASAGCQLADELPVHPTDLHARNDELVRCLMDGVDVEIAMIDAAHNVVMVNSKCAESNQKSPGELIGEKCFRAFRGLETPCAECTGFKAMSTGKTAESEATLQSNGSAIVVRLIATPVLDQHGEPTGFIEVVEDITERKARERELERLNRLYAALSALNQTIARVKSREELFREVCRITAEKVGFRVVWIGCPDPETHVIIPVARAGRDQDYLDTITVYADDRPEGRGASGTCLREGNRCIINHIADDPRSAPWRAAAAAHGVRAAAALPIHFNGKVWGTLTIYDAETDVFQDKEVALLEEVAAAISLALDNLDREARRQRAEEALADAAREWSVSFDAMADAVSLHSFDHTISNVNQSLCDTLGKSKDELIGKKCYRVFHCTDSPIAGCPHEISRATLRKESAEVFDRARNQWLAVSSSPVFDDDGRVLRFIHVVRDITGRKRAEEALRESEKNLALAQRIAHVGYWERDVTTNKSRWSEETFRIFGLEPTAGPFDNQLHIDQIHPDDRQKVIQAASDAFAGIRPYDVEYRIVRPDGSIRYVRGLGEVARDPSGKPVRLFGSGADITEAKFREREIERLNRLYAALSELHQTVVRVKSPAELFDAVCRIAAQRAGFRIAWVGQHDPLTHEVKPIARDGPGKDYIDKIQVYADDRPEGRGPAGNCIRQRKTCIFNDFLNDFRIAPWRTAASDHGLRAVVALPIRFGETLFGALTVYAGETNVFQDKEVALLEEAAAAISLTLERLDRDSQHQREEEALRESEERYRRLFEVESDAILMVDRQTGRFLDANAAALRLYGYEREEFLRREATEISAEPEQTRMAIAAGQAHVPLRWHRKNDGTVFPVEINASYFSCQGRTVHVVAVRDISERKRVEDDLLAATRAAQAANRAKSEFLANMSHEIRTPMTAILGFSDLLMAQNLSHGEQCEFLEGIRRNGRALLELIGDILDLSRIEADKLTLEKIACPLQQIIDDVLAVVQVRAREKQLCLEVDRRYPLPEQIHTDPLRLRQILVNLAGNAVKFTEQGEVRIAVRCLAQTDETMQMQFAVSDTGIGIPAEKIGTLFQPFTQADASASRRYTGAGLGLAISQHLARALGGDIQVASEPGKGSTFTLTVDAGSRRGVPMLESPPAPASADESSADQQPSVFRGRLLLVEDDPDLQRIIRLLLRKMKVAVNVAKNGQTACDMADLSKAEGRPYDLILMDIQMPGMNGFEATQKLRGRGWQGPIIALTAHAMAGDREKCLASGCNDYIVKPLIATGLQKVLARHMTPSAKYAY